MNYLYRDKKTHAAVVTAAPLSPEIYPDHEFVGSSEEPIDTFNAYFDDAGVLVRHPGREDEDVMPPAQDQLNAIFAELMLAPGGLKSKKAKDIVAQINAVISKPKAALAPKKVGLPRLKKTPPEITVAPPVEIPGIGAHFKTEREANPGNPSVGDNTGEGHRQ